MVIDLFCGRGGWTKGFLAEGYQAIGFDIERHSVYPGELVLQDVATLDGRQFRGASVIVASPPCQRYSYMAMPWDRAKREIRWQEWARTSSFSTGFDLNDLYNHCFRIAREAVCPLVVENVKGAQRWVGRAAWHYGSFYLWGDVPALMPFTSNGVKVPGLNWSGSDKPGYKAQAFNCTAEARLRGVKVALSGREWFTEGLGKVSSASDSRKAASAAIAEIPFDLAQWIARCFKP